MQWYYQIDIIHNVSISSMGVLWGSMRQHYTLLNIGIVVV